MKIRITRPCVIEVLPGSIVEVSEEQRKYLDGYYEVEEVKETPERKTKTTRKAK